LSYIKVSTMIVPLTLRAAAVVTATLATFSAQNMFQTFSTCTGKNNVGSAAKGDVPKIITFPAEDSFLVNDVVEQLQNMKRKELLELFLRSNAPADLNYISGPWNGTLLENNGWVMTSVSKLLTNQLFSRGDRRWNGKVFFAEEATGWNRFETKDGRIEKEHKVDVSLGPSGMDSGDRFSVNLKYNNYQDYLSLWRSMTDELRVLQLDNNPMVDGEILIGFGSMAWSGGKLNGSPFCLYRRKTPKDV